MNVYYTSDEIVGLNFWRRVDQLTHIFYIEMYKYIYNEPRICLTRSSPQLIEKFPRVGLCFVRTIIICRTTFRPSPPFNVIQGLPRLWGEVGGESTHSEQFKVSLVTSGNRLRKGHVVLPLRRQGAEGRTVLGVEKFCIYLPPLLRARLVSFRFSRAWPVPLLSSQRANTMTTAVYVIG